MQKYYQFAFLVSFISTIIFGLIEWRAPGFVSYVFPFPLLILLTGFLAFWSRLAPPPIMSCLFCQIVSGEIPCHKIYENEKVLAFLDIFPVSKGHTLLIPKAHAQDLAASSMEDAVELMRVIHDLAPKITKAIGASGYNLGMNHGLDAGQDVLHTHLHIMPRYNGDERKFVKTHPSQEELAKVAEEIRGKL
ncbi:MAG: HIT family protein [Patescibacteria group bacterium]|jgi:histidine triad (HIT) family protein